MPSGSINSLDANPIAERILTKIVWECYVDYLHGDKGNLVIDGIIEWTPEEDAYLQSLFVEPPTLDPADA